MMFLNFYLVFSVLVAVWTAWYIHQKLDKFDWTYHKSKIWLSLVLRTIFWPVMLLFKPAELLLPKFGFRTGAYGVDLAETTRRRAQFMKNPPPCNSKIIYRAKDYDEKTIALFYFSAGAVEAMAHKVIDETRDVIGLLGTAKWSALRDDAIDTPTELPGELVNFDYICEGLIEAGHGQVCCLACNKIYSAGEIVKQTCFIGSWLMAYYRCPTQHELMSREVGHFMFKRNDE